MIPIGARLAQHTDERGGETCLIFAMMDGSERHIRWAELDARSNQIARLLAEHGVVEGDRVVLALRNIPEMVFALWAVWKAGATAIPLRWDLPLRERTELIALAEPVVTVSSWDDLPAGVAGLTLDDLTATERLDTGRPATRTPRSLFILGSGGSTGRPKLIDVGVPGLLPPSALRLPPIVQRSRQARIEDTRTLVCGPLYHAGPIPHTVGAGFVGYRAILMEKFDAALAIDLIERHRATVIALAPTMMQRMLQVPDVASRDFSSVDLLMHTGGPCPAWVKRGWLELIGAERVFELYGMSERLVIVSIWGDEWLQHPGSVGRPKADELRILDESGQDVPQGSVGYLYFRQESVLAPGASSYIGAEPPPATEDGFRTAGDLGWVDEDGYLYISDRRADMIVSGGANVFPAEVEAALSSHPSVADVVVVGLPDEEWGRRVHAIVQPADSASPPDVGDLNRHVREHLAAYKAPKTYEMVSELPRSESGKIRRSALAEERIGQAPNATHGKGDS